MCVCVLGIRLVEGRLKNIEYIITQTLKTRTQSKFTRVENDTHSTQTSIGDFTRFFFVKNWLFFLEFVLDFLKDTFTKALSKMTLKLVAF